MGISPYHNYFCANISAACFKMSFSILNCRFSLRRKISSVCSGVRLSFSWLDPLELILLRRMGFTKEEMTAHGFRGMASTLLHENGFKSDVIEAQLAHAERNKVKAAYNHAEYLAERVNMMQWWADYLDNLKAQTKGIPLRVNEG